MSGGLLGGDGINISRGIRAKHRFLKIEKKTYNLKIIYSNPVAKIATSTPIHMRANHTRFLFWFCAEIQTLKELLSKWLSKPQLLTVYK